MPLRITPNKLLLISYDAKQDVWVALEGVSLFLLSHYVEIEPGVTIEDLFNLIERDKKLKGFLSEYCCCDIDTVRQRSPTRKSPIEVPTGVEYDEQGNCFPVGIAFVDTIFITPFFFVGTEEHTGQRRLDGSFVLFGGSSEYPLCKTGLGGDETVTYSDVKNLVVKLEASMAVSECDEDKVTDDDPDPIAFHANIRFTLLDVLDAVVRHFGTEDFDPRYQKEVDEDNEFLDRFRKRDNPFDDDTK